MRTLIGIVSCILMVFISTRSSAQLDDSAIPACSPAELRTVDVILRDYLDEYAIISHRVGEVTADDFSQHAAVVDELIIDLNELQLQWWQEGEPQMPHC